MSGPLEGIVVVDLTHHLGGPLATMALAASGIVLDLRVEAARAVLHELVESADVVVHSLSPGVAERLGAGAGELRRLNPRLVYCSLSAFGPAGPRGTDVALSRPDLERPDQARAGEWRTREVTPVAPAAI